MHCAGRAALCAKPAERSRICAQLVQGLPVELRQVEACKAKKAQGVP